MAGLVIRMAVLFSRQSQDIQFNEWIDLSTLCLAPLIAHIIAGVPSATFRHPERRPKWHERMGIFNPTSIIWRYFAILDRRVRAKSWDALTMAASNAVFWTSEGWDGSEAMITKSDEYCLRKPAHTHIDFFSGTSAKTLIVALQGVEALYTLLLGITSPKSNKYANLVAFNFVFTPLAIFGLLRLPVAFWLAEDYSFENVEPRKQDNESGDTPIQESEDHLLKHEPVISVIEHPMRGHAHRGAVLEKDLFHPVNSWRGLTVRILFLVLLFPLWGITLYYLTPLNGHFYTTTTLLINVFYLIFLTVTLFILAAYFFRGVSSTTIIPCVTSRWYKLYTLFLLVLVVVILVISGLQTRRTPCGRYTTYPSKDDEDLCPKLFGRTSN